MQVAVKNRLQRMGDYDFEYFVADLWERMGWDCEVSQASVDAGIDVVATKSNPYPEKKLIQAKRYGPNTTVGGPDIQQYASLKHQEPGVDSVIVVTTNSFTRAAKKRAQELNVKLVDGDGLVSIIKELSAEDLVERYGAESSDRLQSHIETPNTQSTGADIESRESEKGLLKKTEETYDWHRMMLKSIGLAFVFLLTGGFLLNTGIGLLEAVGSIIALAWAATIAAVALFFYLDIRHVRQHSSWNPIAWQYLLGLLVFYVTIPLYLYRRYKTIGL